MALRRNANSTPMPQAAAAQMRQDDLRRAAINARRFIAAGAIGEVHNAMLTARDRGDAEMQAVYAAALAE